MLSAYLQDKSPARGRILVLITNQLGDHQMRMYFNATDADPGMICEDENRQIRIIWCPKLQIRIM